MPTVTHDFQIGFVTIFNMVFQMFSSIDYKKAFNSVDRESIWNELNNLGVIHFNIMFYTKGTYMAR